MSQQIYLLTGANLGDKRTQLRKAAQRLSAEMDFVKESAIYETAAWGKEDQDIFYNQCLCYQTDLSPQQVLSIIQKIENQLGRVRGEKWGARLIDIDILFYGNEQISTSNLQIPHPFMEQRKFALIPLAEIAPSLRHPIHGLTPSQMLTHCTDKLSVQKLPSFENSL